MADASLGDRLAALEARLGRVEELLAGLGRQLERSQKGLEAAREAIQAWVSDYVSLRLQQLVPEACAHAPAPAGEGPLLPGTTIRCTAEVVHRLGRIPIPFVRQMVTQKVADAARAQGVALVDLAFFERAATF